MLLIFRQQWKDEKSGLEMQMTDLRKKFKRNEENLQKYEKESKKVCCLKQTEDTGVHLQ